MKILASVIAVLFLFVPPVYAASPFITPWPAFENSSGSPCSGCKLCFYTTGTSTLTTTYTTSAATVANSNPIILNSRGEPATGIFYDGTVKVILKTAGSDDTCSTGTILRTYDGISPAIGSVASTVTQWSATGLTPTYISATQFSTAGDNTSTFQVGRRVQITDTASTDYGRITASSYATSVTTVTVSLDSGSIDSGISAVSVGLITPTNPSVAFDSIATGTSAANLTSSGSNTWSGSQRFTSTITSSGANSFSGVQTVTGGINSSATNTWSGAQTVSGASTFSGTITSSNTNTFSGTQNITGTVTSAATATWNGTFTITGSIISSGANTFSGVQTVTGAQTISGSINSSATNTWSNTQTISGAIVSSSTNTFSGTQNITGAIVSSGANTLSGTQTITGNINSSGTNTFAGETSIEGASITSTPTGTAIPVSSLDGTLDPDWIGNIVSGGTGSTASFATHNPQVDMGTVTAGDTIFVTASTQQTMNAGAADEYVAVKISQASGAATITFNDPIGGPTTIANIITNNTVAATSAIVGNTAVTVSGVVVVTGSGTLVLQANGLNGGTIASSISTSIYAVFLRKQ